MIKTERLILRPWKAEDFEPFAKMNADPRVMEYYLSTLTKEESDARAKVFSDEINELGFGFWAVSLPQVADFIGMIGLRAVPAGFSHFSPAIEIGWRLAFEFWDQGYATEGALGALRFGFDRLQFNEIVAFTAALNTRSQKVMKKIGMHHDKKDDFNHPGLGEGHPLRPHVLYRLSRHEFSITSPVLTSRNEILNG